MELQTFAFFVVNFGYTKRDYDELTMTERAFIMKAYENKIVTDSTIERNAVANALANCFRKKGKREIPLWRRKLNHKQIEKQKRLLDKAKQNEKNDDKEWIKKVYQNVGKSKRKKPNGK